MNNPAQAQARARAIGLERRNAGGGKSIIEHYLPSSQDPSRGNQNHPSRENTPYNVV